MLGKINSFKITQMINSKKVFIEKETKRVRTTLNDYFKQSIYRKINQTC